MTPMGKTSDNTNVVARRQEPARLDLLFASALEIVENKGSGGGSGSGSSSSGSTMNSSSGSFVRRDDDEDEEGEDVDRHPKDEKHHSSSSDDDDDGGISKATYDKSRSERRRAKYRSSREEEEESSSQSNLRRMESPSCVATLNDAGPAGARPEPYPRRASYRRRSSVGSVEEIAATLGLDASEVEVAVRDQDDDESRRVRRARRGQEDSSVVPPRSSSASSSSSSRHHRRGGSGSHRHRSIPSFLERAREQLVSAEQRRHFQEQDGPSPSHLSVLPPLSLREHGRSVSVDAGTELTESLRPEPPSAARGHGHGHGHGRHRRHHSYTSALGGGKGHRRRHSYEVHPLGFSDLVMDALEDDVDRTQTNNGNNPLLDATAAEAVAGDANMDVDVDEDDLSAGSGGRYGAFAKLVRHARSLSLSSEISSGQDDEASISSSPPGRTRRRGSHRHRAQSETSSTFAVHAAEIADLVRSVGNEHEEEEQEQRQRRHRHRRNKQDKKNEDERQASSSRYCEEGLRAASGASFPSSADRPPVEVYSLGLRGSSQSPPLLDDGRDEERVSFVGVPETSGEGAEDGSPRHPLFRRANTFPEEAPTTAASSEYGTPAAAGSYQHSRAHSYHGDESSYEPDNGRLTHRRHRRQHQHVRANSAPTATASRYFRRSAAGGGFGGGGSFLTEIPEHHDSYGRRASDVSRRASDVSAPGGLDHDEESSPWPNRYRGQHR